MHLKAIFLDFYGTLVHEDDEIIPGICEKISFHSPQPVPVKVIGDTGGSSSLRDSAAATVRISNRSVSLSSRLCGQRLHILSPTVMQMKLCSRNFNIG